MLIGLIIVSGVSHAQNIDQVRWKNETKVREILGEPLRISEPIGTHASYTMWTYDGFMVAFANNLAFHLFRTGGSGKLELDEDRQS